MLSSKTASAWPAKYSRLFRWAATFSPPTPGSHSLRPLIWLDAHLLAPVTGSIDATPPFTGFLFPTDVSTRASLLLHHNRRPSFAPSVTKLEGAVSCSVQEIGSGKLRRRPGMRRREMETVGASAAPRGRKACGGAWGGARRNRPEATRSKDDSNNNSDESDEEPPQKKLKDSSSGAAKPASKLAKKARSSDDDSSEESSGSDKENDQSLPVKKSVQNEACELNGHDLMGRPVRLNFAQERGAFTPGSGRDNSSFKKPGQSSSSTAFIRGFDSAHGEDQLYCRGIRLHGSFVLWF